MSDKNKKEVSENVNTELETVNTEIVAATPGIPFAQISGFGLKPNILKKISDAPKLNFNTKAETWSPETKGERKRMIFQGIIEKAKTKNIFGDDPEFVYLDKAQFVEIYEEDGVQKQRMIEMYGAVAISYLINNRVPKHAIMDVVYAGKAQGKTFKYDDFEFILVPIEF